MSPIKIQGFKVSFLTLPHRCWFAAALCWSNCTVIQWKCGSLSCHFNPHTFYYIMKWDYYKRIYDIQTGINQVPLYMYSCIIDDIHEIPHSKQNVNPLNAELNPICYLLALLAHHFLHVNRIRVKSLTLRLLMSYIYIYIWSAYSWCF